MKSTSLMAFAIAILSTAQLAAMNTNTILTTPAPGTERILAEINPFCKAIIQGDIATVETMIELGEDVNRKSLGKTPLIYAARYNKAEILQLLLDNGADPAIRCDRGYSPMKHAKLSGATAAMEVLRDFKKA